MAHALVPYATKRKLDDLVGMAAVRWALDALRLGIYADAFDDAGYDDLAYIRAMGPTDLKILADDVQMKPGHYHKLVDWLPDLDAHVAAMESTTTPQSKRPHGAMGHGKTAPSATAKPAAAALTMSVGGRALHLSRKSPTGYTNVYVQPSGRFSARQPGGTRSLGTFATAVDAAVAYANAVAAKNEGGGESEGEVEGEERQEASQHKRRGKTYLWPTVAGDPPPRDALPPDVADDKEASEVYAALQRLKADGVERKLTIHGYDMAYHLRGGNGGKAVGGFWNARAAPITLSNGDLLSFPQGQVCAPNRHRHRVPAQTEPPRGMPHDWRGTRFDVDAPRAHVCRCAQTST